MLQDIGPHLFDNTFCQGSPGPADPILLYGEDSVFLQGTEEALTIPLYRDIQGSLTPLTGSFIRLFTVDGAPYYLFYSHESFAALPLVKKPIRFLRGFSPSWMAFAAITGYQLSKWYHEHRFCGKCGKPTRLSDRERAITCDGCPTVVYPKLSPAVIVGVTHGNRLLLTRYAGRAYQNYALVAGFVEIGETLEQAVRREVLEEVGLAVRNIRYFDNQPWSFSDSLLIGFFADLEGDDRTTLDQNELAEAVWMSREQIPQASPFSLTGTMIEAFRSGQNV